MYDILNMQIKNMRRKKRAEKIENQVKTILKRNPEIKKALRMFDISQKQYQKSLGGNYSYHSATSTSPASLEVNNKSR